MEKTKIIGDAGIGDTISFDVYPSTILGTNYKKVKLLAVLDLDTVKVFGTNPYAKHAEVYPYLPEGSINDPSKYSWLKIELPATGLNKSTRIECIGIPWIKTSTVMVHSGHDCKLVINDVSLQDPERIRSILTQAGYEIGDVELVNK